MNLLFLQHFLQYPFRFFVYVPHFLQLGIKQIMSERLKNVGNGYKRFTARNENMGPKVKRYGALYGAYLTMATYAANTRLPWWRHTAAARCHDSSRIMVDGFDNVGIIRLGNTYDNFPFADIDATPVKRMSDSACEVALQNVLGDHFCYDKSYGLFTRKKNGAQIAQTTWATDDRRSYRLLLFDQSGAFVVQKLMEELTIPKDV